MSRERINVGNFKTIVCPGCSKTFLYSRESEKDLKIRFIVTFAMVGVWHRSINPVDLLI